MKVSMKMYLAVMALMAVVGGDTAYSMKESAKKRQFSSVAKNSDTQDKKKKRKTEKKKTEKPETEKKKTEKPETEKKKTQVKAPELLSNTKQNKNEKEFKEQVEKAVILLVEKMKKEDAQRMSDLNQVIKKLENMNQRAWWNPVPSNAAEFFMSVAGLMVSFSLQGVLCDYVMVLGGALYGTRFLIAVASGVYDALFKARPQDNPSDKKQEESKK